jgi:hypothetical protein
VFSNNSDYVGGRPIGGYQISATCNYTNTVKSMAPLSAFYNASKLSVGGKKILTTGTL